MDLPHPTSCILWTDPEQLRDLRMETVTVFEEDDHFRRALLKCPECGQLYFYQMREEVDFDGDDPVYRTYIPVASADQAATLAKVSQFELMTIHLALHSDWPADQETSTIFWSRATTPA